MQVEFMKPDGGGLGFALVGGTNGSVLRVKEICSGGVAEQDGRLRVGDILLEVTTSSVSGITFIVSVKTQVLTVHRLGKRRHRVRTELRQGGGDSA